MISLEGLILKLKLQYFGKNQPMPIMWEWLVGHMPEQRAIET